MPGASGDPVAAALTRYIIRGRSFTTIEQVASEFGRTRAEQNRALAAEAGVSLRTVQRWRTTGAERRNFNRSRSVGPLRAAAAHRYTSRRITSIRRRGLGMRLKAWRRVSRDIKIQEMPGPIAGRPQLQHITGPALVPALNAWLAGDQAGAADELLDAFFDAYRFAPSELGEIIEVTLQ